MEKDIKVFGAIKSIEGRMVTGFASIFGNVDVYGDVVHRGAFTKTIKEQGSRIKHLWQHDSWEPPIAAIRELRETGREELPDEVKQKYPEADGGLLVKREYLDTPRGNEVLAGINSGAITEMSFMYNRIKWDVEEFDDGDRISHLRELRLWETSDVNWGANAATVASKAADERFKRMILLQQLLKNGVNGLGFDVSKQSALMNLLEQFGKELAAEPQSDGKALTDELFADLSLLELEI